jgi:ABC-type phosphate transport system substrate-binding protein
MKRFSLLILLALTTTPLFAAGYKLVAHPSVPVSTLAKKDASAIFLKKTAKWEDGTPVLVVDQVATSPVRESFTTAVHGKSVAAIRSFWQQQVFSGRDVPPLEEKSDAQVLTFVRTKPGAIGYVSDTAQLTGVKVIEVR